MISSLQKIGFICLLAIITPTGALSDDQICRFDFGTNKSPIFPGFIQVDKDTLYSQKKGFGWDDVAGEAREHFDRGGYDDLCRDLVMVRKGTFKVDIPSGWYFVNVWIGDLYDLSDYLRFEIKAEGHVFVEAGNKDFKTYNDFYFKNSNYDYKKGDNPWDICINSRFILKTFLVEVSDGQLNVEFKDCRLNGMVIYPLGLTKQGQKEITEINSKRRKQFEEDWIEVRNDEVGTRPKISPEDIQRGYTLFARNWMEKIYPETAPEENETVTSLDVFCATGEYEPITFCIYPLENLEKVRIMVEHLFDSSGNKFDTQNIEVRAERYRISKARDKMTYSIQPAQITKFYEIDVEQNITRKFWLDFYVPLNTKPGIYEGDVWIKPANKPTSRLRLKLHVLPFELLWNKQKHNYALQYITPAHLVSFRNDNHYWEYVEKDYRFMQKFGITLPVLGYDRNSWPIIKWNSQTKRLEDINLSNIEKAMAVYNKVGGFQSPYVIFCMYHMTGNGYYKVPQKLNTAGKAISGQEPDFWMAYKEIVNAVKERQIKNYWPEFIFLLTAETSNSYLDHIIYGQKIHEQLQEIPGIKTAGMSNSWKEFQMLSPKSNITGMQISVCTDDAVLYGQKNSLDHSFWIYQGNNRFIYGFYYHKIDAKGMFKEDFQHVSADPYNGFDGNGDEITLSVKYSLPTADGPVPLFQCYEYREGIDDARYLYTLEEHIRKAKLSPNLHTRQQAEKAEIVLKKILSRVNPDLTYYINEVGFWDNLAFDKLRKQITDQLVLLKTSE